MEIYSSVLNMPAAALQEKSSLPRFRDRLQNKPLIDAGLLSDEREGFGYQTGFRELPYTIQEGYHRNLTQRDLNTVVMENDFLRATFLADYGGRLWSLYDKRAGQELLFSNPVFRLANLAIRNAWFSGGIEWNLGQYGHTCLTCEPIFFARCTDRYGVPFLRMYEYERQKCFFFQIDFHLPEDSDYLFAHVKILNTKDESVPLYWWTNIAVREDRNVRVFSAADGVIRINPETMSSQDSVHGFTHDSMPYLKTLVGTDASYPKNSPYSNEYFFQNRARTCDTWEAAVYNDGTAFWERSTPVLRYRKMFCWGTQRGGKHWKDFLSEEGKGDYLEIQGGISPTQVHGENLDAKGSIRFTQVFGGMEIHIGDAFGEWESSKDYVHSLINRQLSEDDLMKADLKYIESEDVQPDEILHFGTGWGALEAARDPNIVPNGLIFPKETLGDEQKPWLELLQTGKMPELEKGDLPASWMTDPRWTALLMQSLHKEENQSAAAYLHLGIMFYEDGRWQKGIDAMKKSLELCPTAICCRNLAEAMVQENNLELACDYMEEALSLGNAHQCGVFAQDAIKIFTLARRFQRAWNCYSDLTDEQKQSERARLNILKAAFELKNWGFLEKQFTSDFAIMREGETMLLDIWFEVQAIRLAHERGVLDYHILLDEVKDTIEPPYNIDFRMIPAEVK